MFSQTHCQKQSFTGMFRLYIHPIYTFEGVKVTKHKYTCLSRDSNGQKKCIWVFSLTVILVCHWGVPFWFTALLKLSLIAHFVPIALKLLTHLSWPCISDRLPLSISLDVVLCCTAKDVYLVFLFFCLFVLNDYIGRPISYEFPGGSLEMYFRPWGW